MKKRKKYNYEGKYYTKSELYKELGARTADKVVADYIRERNKKWYWKVINFFDLLWSGFLDANDKYEGSSDDPRI